MRIGSDFEVPLTNKYEAVPAHMFVHGTKENPQPVAHGHVQYDNAMLEMNTEVADDKKTFVDSFYAVIKDAEELLPKDVNILYSDHAYYDTYLDFPELQTMGCEPELNAFTGVKDTVSRELVNLPVRTAGLHLHIDIDSSEIDKALFIRALEYLVTLPMLAHEFVGGYKPEEEFNRRLYYGKAGSYRSKSYGVEWRTPSPIYLAERKYMEEFYDLVEYTFDNWHNYTAITEDAQMNRQVQRIINNRDVSAATELYAAIK